MRKLKLQIQISVDGFIAGPNGEMDWMVWDWDDELKQFTQELTDSFDCIVLGKKLAEGFIPYWKTVADDPANPEQEAGKKFTDTQKVVFTKTLDKSNWDNTVLAKGDLNEEIGKLKNQDGKDIIVYGGATFVSSLLKNSMIDELNFFVNPTLNGNGMTIFGDIRERQNLKLINCKAYSCGISVMTYSLNR